MCIKFARFFLFCGFKLFTYVFTLSRVQGAWLLINVALFTYQYWNFQATDKFYYMRLRTRVRMGKKKRIVKIGLRAQNQLVCLFCQCRQLERC